MRGGATTPLNPPFLHSSFIDETFKGVIKLKMFIQNIRTTFDPSYNRMKLICPILCRYVHFL